jgi:hypothetical protein
MGVICKVLAFEIHLAKLLLPKLFALPMIEDAPAYLYNPLITGDRNNMCLVK